MLRFWQYGSLPFGFAQGRDFRKEPITAMTAIAAMTRDSGDFRVATAA
jgi:hypothetical protein